MTEQHKDLTGRWMGRYEYDRGGTPTAFEAELTEAADLSGEMWEPNGFRKDLGAELSATLSGARTGDQVSFVKRYLGFEQGDHPIYDGTANAALTRIEGRWRFTHQPGWGGRFVMMRKAKAAATAEQTQTEPVEG